MNKFFLFVFLITLFVTIILALQRQIFKQHAQQAETVTVTVGSPSIINKLIVGASLIHTDTNSGAFSSTGLSLIRNVYPVLNVHIMGFGTDNPEPSKGKYDWASLDERVQAMRDVGATKMITLCCAPDWMKGGISGQTDWDSFEDAPLASHYADFAELARQVALRYPDVEYFQVWNELKGMFNDSRNRWDYEGYTTLYNMVYDAIKSIRPTAKIGGPYVSIDHWSDSSAGGFPATDPTLVNQSWGTVDQRSLDVISYWLSHKKGADFLIVDGWTETREGTMADEFANASIFSAINTWIQKQPGAANLPIVWAEWYPLTAQTNVDATHRSAVVANAYIQMMTSGGSRALMWGVEGNAQAMGDDNAPTILTASAQPTALYTVMKNFKNYFSPGTQLMHVSVSNSVKVAAAASPTTVILVNKTGNPLAVIVNTTTVSLGAYEVKFVSYANNSSSPTPSPTPTPIQNSEGTAVALTLALHGLGKGGDNSNPNGTGNANPLSTQRAIVLRVYNSANTLVKTVSGTVHFDSASGLFKGVIDLGTDFATGYYQITVQTNHFLQASIPGIQTIARGGIQTLPVTSLITGDITNDNQLNILDYNILIGCYSDLQSPKDCPSGQKEQADITDDGNVNFIDYNLFLRELTNIPGQ